MLYKYLKMLKGAFKFYGPLVISIVNKHIIVYSIKDRFKYTYGRRKGAEEKGVICIL